MKKMNINDQEPSLPEPSHIPRLAPGHLVHTLAFPDKDLIKDLFSAADQDCYRMSTTGQKCRVPIHTHPQLIHL